MTPTDPRPDQEAPALTAESERLHRDWHRARDKSRCAGVKCGIQRDLVAIEAAATQRATGPLVEALRTFKRSEAELRAAIRSVGKPGYLDEAIVTVAAETLADLLVLAAPVPAPGEGDREARIVGPMLRRLLRETDDGRERIDLLALLCSAVLHLEKEAPDLYRQYTRINAMGRVVR